MIDELVHRLLHEYAQNGANPGPFDPGLSIRDDLGIESLSLVSLAVRLGDHLGVDVASEEMELGSLRCVADVLALGRRLQHAAATSRVSA